MNFLEAALLHMSINLRSGNVGMAEHHLDRTQVSPVIEEVGGERVPECVRRDALVQASGERCAPDGALGPGFVEVVPTEVARPGVSREPGRREEPLP